MVVGLPGYRETKPCLLLFSNAVYTPYFFVCLNGATFRGLNKPSQPAAATPGLVGKFAAASRILYWGSLGSGRKVFLLVSAELAGRGRSLNQFKILWSAMGLVSSGVLTRFNIMYSIHLHTPMLPLKVYHSLWFVLTRGQIQIQMMKVDPWIGESKEKCQTEGDASSQHCTLNNLPYSCT